MLTFVCLVLLAVLAVVGLALALLGVALSLAGLALLLCGRTRESPDRPPAAEAFVLRPDALTPAPRDRRPSFRV